MYGYQKVMENLLNGLNLCQTTLYVTGRRKCLQPFKVYIVLSSDNYRVDIAMSCLAVCMRF